MNLVLVLAFLLGGALGFGIAWLVIRSNSTALNVRLSIVQQDLAAARVDVGKFREVNAELNKMVATIEATIKAERKANDEKLEVLTRAEEKLLQTFGSLAAEALSTNNQVFLDLAKESLGALQGEARSDLELRQQAVEALVAPVSESLKRVDEQIRQIEGDRNQAYGDLRAQIRSLITTQDKLHAETGNLVKALRTPAVRGRWGEIQLKRVVEIAGMLNYCDFVEQETVNTSAGRLRPDLVVKLPGGKNVIVDAKTPLMAYIEAIETTDDELRRQKLIEHANQVRNHLNQLSSKAYQEQFEATPEFVVMFLPGETFFSAALEQDPALIEYGVGQRVIPASPTTLIALLKAIAYGWNQEKLARNAQQISALGKELHERLRSMAGHVEGVGRGLDRAVESYNKAIGALETRVMVSARRFAELGAPVTEEIENLHIIDTTTRNLTLDFDDNETQIKLSIPLNQESPSTSDEKK